MSEKPRKRFEELDPIELRRLIEEKEKELEELKAALTSSEGERKKHVSHQISNQFKVMAERKE